MYGASVARWPPSFVYKNVNVIIVYRNSIRKKKQGNKKLSLHFLAYFAV